MARLIKRIGTAQFYTDLQDFEDSASAQDLVTDGDIWAGYIHDDQDWTAAAWQADFAGTGSFDVDNYVEIQPNIGDEHDGTVNGTGVLIDSAQTGHLMDVRIPFTYWHGLRLKHSNLSGSDEIFRLGNSTVNPEGTRIFQCVLVHEDVSGVNVDDCDVIYAGNYPAGTATNPIRVENCALISLLDDDSGGAPASRCAVHSQAFSGSGDDHYWEIIQCTIIGAFDKAGIGYNATSGTITFVIKNCLSDIAGSGGAYDYGSSGGSGTPTTTGSDYNVSGSTIASGRALPGSNSLGGYTITDNLSPGAGDWAIVADNGTNDLRSAEDLDLVDDADQDLTALCDGNATDSDIPTVDILGRSRGDPCYPGAFELQVAGGTRRVVFF